MNGKRFAIAVLVDVTAASLMMAWLVGEIAMAETLFKAAFWVLTPLTILGLLAAPDNWAELRQHPAWFRGYSRGVNLGVLLALAWAGETAMCAIWVLKMFLVEVVLRKLMANGAAHESES